VSSLRSSPSWSTKLAELHLAARFVWHVIKRLGQYLAAVVVYSIAGATLLRWDLARTGYRAGDFAESLYAIYTQLFFEPTAILPHSMLGRTLFFITPMVGAALIGGGILRVGSDILSTTQRTLVRTQLLTETLSKHVVVCGIGHVGFRVVGELRSLNIPMVAIERAESDFVETLRERGIPVHIGDARRDQLLEQVGIARARAVVCATDNDLANLEIALDAKRMNPSIRVLMRMFDQRLAAKVGGALDLDQSFSTSSLSAPLIAHAAIRKGVRGAYRLGDSIRVAYEFTVGRGAPETVAALEEATSCRVLTKRDGAGHYLPIKANDALAQGMVLVVDAEERSLETLDRVARVDGAS
jgi:voltage-gated potassium channel